MAQARHETPIDAKFVSAYDMYKHQIEETNRSAHRRNRRGADTERATVYQAEEVVEERDERRDENSFGKRLSRLLVNSSLIGYAAALAYFMAADGPSETGATRL